MVFRSQFSLLVLLMAVAANEAKAVDFENDIIPLLTKHGCNSGACHGAAIGRGGLKLSLYGGDPDSDFEAIVLAKNGRRVNLANPSKSLIILKPAEHISHGGGTLFDIEDESAAVLLRWVRDGATNRSTRQLKRVVFSPSRFVAKNANTPLTLKATAVYSDDTSRDVTRWAVFKPEDEAAVRIQTTSQSGGSDSAQTTTATILRRGRHLIVARYLNRVEPIEIVLPLSDIRSPQLEKDARSFVDVEVAKKLNELGLPPSGQINDSQFLRRLTLDLTGRLPSKQQVLETIEGSSENHQASDLSRREKLLDQLLHSKEFTEYWTLQLAKLLRLRPQPNDSEGARVYHSWLSSQLARQASYREIARSLILASGDSHKHGPANFYRTVKGAREQAEFMSELFMGSRLRCANCHNHPLDRWTQDDYHGLAAIFAKVDVGQVIKPKPGGLVIHPRTLEPAVPKIPGEKLFQTRSHRNNDSSSKTHLSGRQALADWLTAAENPYFAKAIVNRLWKRMMGRGLVEPVDDFRATNPATHPELLNQLARDFVEHGYRIRRTLKVIASSAAYSRSSNATKQNKDDDRFYSHAIRRVLEPEVLADAISDVLGVPAKYGNQPQGTRAVALVDPRTPSQALDILGRCGREESCEDSASSVGGLAQKLHLFNGALLNARIGAKGSRLMAMLQEGQDSNRIVEEFYLVALGRKPTLRENAHWAKQWGGTGDRRQFFEDFVWGLLTSEEFSTNH